MIAVLTEEMQVEFQSLDFGALDSLDKVITPEEIAHKKWLQSRLGILSGSQIHKLCTYKTKDELPSGAYDYISEKVYERVFGEQMDYYESPEMEHGKKYEMTAVAMVEAETNISFSQTGADQKFLVKDNVGATPDGVSKQYILECKCPGFKAHNKYKRMKSGADLEKTEEKYWLQMQTEMLTAGKKKGIFASLYVHETTGFKDLFWIVVDACGRTQTLIKRRAELAEIEIQKQVANYAQ